MGAYAYIEAAPARRGTVLGPDGSQRHCPPARLCGSVLGAAGLVLMGLSLPSLLPRAGSSLALRVSLSVHGCAVCLRVCLAQLVQRGLRLLQLLHEGEEHRERELDELVGAVDAVVDGQLELQERLSATKGRTDGRR